MKTLFLETGNVARFRKALAALEDVEKGQPGLGVVWGRAGRGKTFCSREYSVQTSAVYLRVLESWTPRGMLSQLCREINGSEPRTVDGCMRTILGELEREKRTILVDEADRLNISLVEHFRDIHDLTGVPVVLIGEEHLFPTINARRRLWSRVTQTVEFGPITAEDVMLFAIKAADIRVDSEAAKRLVARSGGDFRLIWQDVRDLEQIARANGVKDVSAQMVSAMPQRKAGPSVVKGVSNGR